MLLLLAPPPPDPVARYGGGRMDVERMESHVAKWLSDNCVDTNATVLQNIRLFQDHASNVDKDKVALYETRGDMELLSPDAANPNAFSDMVTRLCKDYNDANPNWQAAGGDIRSGRFEYLPEKVAPCGLHARRNHGTKTGPTTAKLSVVLVVVSTSPAAACSRPSLVSFTSLLFGKLMSSFLSGQNSAISNILLVRTMHPFRTRSQN